MNPRTHSFMMSHFSKHTTLVHPINLTSWNVWSEERDIWLGVVSAARSSPVLLLCSIDKRNASTSIIAERRNQSRMGAFVAKLSLPSRDEQFLDDDSLKGLFQILDADCKWSKLFIGSL